MNLFTYDADSSMVNPNPPLKDHDLHFHISGVLSDSVQIERVATSTEWEGAELFFDETPGGSFDDVLEIDLKWKVPGFAPDGDYITYFKGYSKDDQLAFCVKGILTF